MEKGKSWKTQELPFFLLSKLNEMIHDYAEYVVGRMGIPYREKNISIISLVIDAPQTKISELSGKIGRLSGVTAKAAYAKV